MREMSTLQLRQYADSYLESNVYNPEAWNNVRRSFGDSTESQLRPTTRTAEPLETRLGEPILSFENRNRMSVDYFTQELMKKAGTRFHEEFDSIRVFPVQYKENGIAAMTIELTKGKEKLVYTYCMDNRDALLVELGTEIGRKQDFFDYSGGKVSPFLDEFRVLQAMDVFGEPVEREEFQWIVDAFQNERNLFPYDIDKIYQKEIGNRTAFVVHTSDMLRSYTKVFSLTPAEEFLLKEGETDFHGIKIINRGNAVHARPRLERDFDEAPTEEEMKKILDQLELAYASEIKIKRFKGEMAAWINNATEFGIVTILRT